MELSTLPPRPKLHSPLRESHKNSDANDYGTGNTSKIHTSLINDYTQKDNKNANYYIHALKDLKGYQYVRWLVDLRRCDSSQTLKSIEYFHSFRSKAPSFCTKSGSSYKIKKPSDVEYKGNTLEVFNLIR